MVEFTFNGFVRYGFGFVNPNHAAALIAALLPFALWLIVKSKTIWLKLIAAALTALLLVALALTFSRTGLIVVVLELLLLFFLTGSRNWKVLLSTFIFLLAAAIAIGSIGRFSLDAAVFNRLSIWHAGCGLFRSNWQHGVGMGLSGKIVSVFMVDGVPVRTLVNSHLTLLAEHGLFTGFLWLAVISYALLNGWRKRYSWVAFCGLLISASLSTVFDFDILSDYEEFGGFTFANWLLSWGLLLFFGGLLFYLSSGRVALRKIAGSVIMAAGAVVILFFAGKSGAPELVDDFIFIRGGEEVIAVYDSRWNIRKVYRDMTNKGKGGFISLHPSYSFPEGANNLPPNMVFLYGASTEMQDCFIDKKITIIP